MKTMRFICFLILVALVYVIPLIGGRMEKAHQTHRMHL